MFLNKFEIEQSRNFIEKGYLISEIQEKESLKYISDFFVNVTSSYSENIKINENFLDTLNEIHNKISIEELNNFRLYIIDSMAKDKNFREHYYYISKNLLDIVVGNELAMQNRVNLSIQMPNDDSSLLPIHADTWSGDSPFEAVVWMPLVNCYDTKSMYLLPPKHLSKITNFKNGGENRNDLFEYIKEDVEWIKIDYGQVMIFNQSLPHGNIVNATSETRWSMNCRFKSLFSPYGDKGIGEFFEPITTKPMTKLGLNYKFPF